MKLNPSETAVLAKALNCSQSGMFIFLQSTPRASQIALYLANSCRCPEKDRQKLAPATAAAHLDTRVGKTSVLPAQLFERFLTSKNKAISFWAGLLSAFTRSTRCPSLASILKYTVLGAVLVPICLPFRTGSWYKCVINSEHYESRWERHISETSPDQRKYGYQNKPQEKAALNVPEPSKASCWVRENKNSPSLYLPRPLFSCLTTSRSHTSVLPSAPFRAGAMPRRMGRNQLLIPSGSPCVTEGEHVSCLNYTCSA